jgi:hypothetical protein
MKFLLVHNYYQQPGGEDQVFADESALLEAHGHDVIHYTLHNDSMNGMGAFEMARRTLWNPRTYAELRDLIRRERPVLMHCANTFPLVSPAAYYAARAEGVAVVQTLHNYGYCARTPCSCGMAAYAKTDGASLAGLALLFIDLDDFNQVNDTWGHLVGDRVLQVVAERLSTSVRPNDLVVRYGGDEFVVAVEGARRRRDLERRAPHHARGSAAVSARRA